MQLPVGLMKNKSVITLNNFDDNLCFFRCLAVHQGSRPDKATKAARKLFESYYKHRKFDDYAGLDMINEVPNIEKHFNVNLNIYTYHDDDTVTTCRRPLKTTNIINLCVYNNQFCYIKKMDVFTSSFKCRQCDKIFKTGRQIFRHEQTCKVGVQFQYPGGFYQNRQTVFEKLEAMNLYVPKLLHCARL